MPDHRLEADSILYSVAGRQLLTDIYLSCKTGEVVGLLGRNGCGKSTLLKILFGTLPTYNKHIRVNGQVYQEPYKHKHLLAYLPQNDFLPKNLRLRQLIDLYLTAPDKQGAVRQHPRVQPHLQKYTNELSRGELRYFELLLLLQLDVKFLLLDEPFSGIEPIYVDRVQELLQAHLHTKGFLITDHDYTSVMRISNRIILLANGACRPIQSHEELATWGYVPKAMFR
ncbi:MAG TPA: ATP-binding cassette domain-containing protein [Pontibacter sp.]